MQTIVKKYLKDVDLLSLDNWSVQGLIDAKFNYSNKYSLAPISDFLIKSKNVINIDDDKIYSRITVRINNNGVIERDKQIGLNIGTKKQYLAKSGQFIISKIDARNGAFGIIPSELDNAIVTNDFPLFNVNTKKINPQFLLLITTTDVFIKFAQSCSSGTTNRQRMDIDMFLNQKIPLPPLQEQDKIVASYIKKISESEKLKKEKENIDIQIENYIFNELGLSKKDLLTKKAIGLQFINFKIIQEWGIDKIFSNSNKGSALYPLISIEEAPELVINLFRGKSPKYKEGTTAFILNQKCNRWNDIDLSFVKSVDETWLNSIDTKYLTQEGDILINSTGEGTLGRATYIKKEFEGLLYDSHLLLLRFDRKKINAELFVELFNSEYGQNQVNDIKSAQATKQTELGISNLAKIQFPFPDNLQIQNNIINIVKKFHLNKSEKIKTALTLEKEAQIEFEKAIFN